MVVGGASAVFALIATLMAGSAPATLERRLIIAVAMLAQWMMLIYASAPYAGGEFVLDAHMLFFVIMGALVAYYCWFTILFATAIVFFHHLILNFAAPMLIWPSDSFSLVHFFIHCVLAVVTAAATMTLAKATRRLIVKSAAAVRESEAGKRSAEIANREREQIVQQSVAEREALMDELATAFGAVVERATNGDFEKRVEARFPDEKMNHLANRMNTLLATVDAGVSETSRAVGVTGQRRSIGAHGWRLPWRVRDTEKRRQSFVRAHIGRHGPTGPSVHIWTS